MSEAHTRVLCLCVCVCWKFLPLVVMQVVLYDSIIGSYTSCVLHPETFNCKNIFDVSGLLGKSEQFYNVTPLESFSCTHCNCVFLYSGVNHTRAMRRARARYNTAYLILHSYNRRVTRGFPGVSHQPPLLYQHDIFTLYIWFIYPSGLYSTQGEFI